MIDIKNKKGEVIGQYEKVGIAEYKTQSISTAVVNANGEQSDKTVEVTKETILALATQQLNTNVRNYVAGLAREKKDTKTALLKEYLRSKGIDLSLSVEEIKQQLNTL